MKYRLLKLSVAIVIAITVTGSPNNLIAARAQAAETKLNCSNGDVLMTSPGAMSAMKPSGNIDHDFAKAMAVHLDAMMTMERTEIACGKDAKAKKFAQSALEKQLQEIDEARLLTGAGG